MTTCEISSRKSNKRLNVNVDSMLEKVTFNVKKTAENPRKN